MAERVRSRMLDNRYGAIITYDNKTDGYYVVKWDGPLYKLQEENDGFQAVDVVCNATYLNPIQ